MLRVTFWEWFRLAVQSIVSKAMVSRS